MSELKNTNTHKEVPKLETERLFLLPWKYEYAEDMLLFAANETVATERGIKVLTSVKSAKARISAMKRYKSDDWAIALKIDNGFKIIGSIGIQKIDERHWGYSYLKLSYNLVFFIAEEYWGMGICTEAAKVVIDYAFKGIKCDAICANHKLSNNRSRRVIEKCNFSYIEVHPKSRLDDPNSTALYLLTREEYLDSEKVEFSAFS